MFLRRCLDACIGICRTTVKNPIFFWLLIIFTLANIVDSVTALFILPGEANPIFLITGSIWYVILGKIFILAAAWFFYYRNIFPTNIWYFIVIAALTFGSLVVSLGAYSNILGIKNPEIVAAASEMEKSEKINTYFTLSIIFYIIPIALNIVTFILYDKSYKYTVIDKQYYKNKKWWEL
jgi:hypothetical protein